jgi:type I restriction enzyme S subunit
MKQGWEVKKLVDVCIVERGSSPRPIDKYITNDENGVNWIKIGDTKGVDKYIFSTKEKITKEGALKSRYVKKGDFILSNSMSFGKPFIMQTDGYIHDGWFALRLHDFINTEYFYHLLSSPYVNEQFHRLASGSVVKNISGDLVKKVLLPIPSLPEQQKIVAILDEAFTAIEGAKANAALNLKNAKELFDSYLQSVFENRGDGWEEKTLGDVCSLYQGIAINAKTKHALVEKSDLPLLRIKDLKNNTVEQYIDPNNYPKNALVNESDIIYTRTGSLGLVFRGKRGVLHNNSFKVVPTAELNKDYLFIWLQNPIFKSKILSLALKAAQPDITHAIFKIQEIAIPPIKEQEKIVQKLDFLSAQTKRLEAIYQQKIGNLEELKKSILQKAFNGEL